MENAFNADHKLIGFVPFMNKAMRERNPNMKSMWEIILFIQENLRLPASAEFEGVAVVRDLESIRNKIKWPADHDHFARWAYEYLRFAHEIGASEQAIKAIAHTKPNVRTDALDGINAHELAMTRKVNKGDQVADRTYVPRMRSEAEFWVHDKILTDYTKKTVPQTARYDVPIMAHDEAFYIKQMVEAMVDLNGPKDGSEAQIDTVRKMSMTVAQHLAWHLLVSQPSRSSTWKQTDNPSRLSPTMLSRRRDEEIQRNYMGLIRSVADYWVQDEIARSRKTYNTTEAETRNVNRTPLPEGVRPLKSKAAVVDLTITPYAKRFASDPAWELSRKEHNARDNNARARRERERRASVAVQQQFQSRFSSRPSDSSRANRAKPLERVKLRARGKLGLFLRARLMARCRATTPARLTAPVMVMARKSTKALG
ncbi:hypothetical protein B0T20DRAFT_477495 [Sordaria brevicollis]|uniref:Uncharacterized protein n=1 Tax=Sordaria brevicollis TaxID=83679 RepID=A0AAE0PGT8_SORBR|nr:hypothetical protein B0T20DRAFT_477495 [Sordaria brevicollis]